MAYKCQPDIFLCTAEPPEINASHFHFLPVCVKLTELRHIRYYRLFMYHYSLSVRTASFLMVNSTWTKNHIDSILHHSDSVFDLLYLTPPFFVSKFLFTSTNTPRGSKIVYPPCDTRELEIFPLVPRERVILSIAQFRSVDSLISICHFSSKPLRF